MTFLRWLAALATAMVRLACPPEPPAAKVVQGYQPVMPTYQGQLSDREVSGLIEYIKTL